MTETTAAAAPVRIVRLAKGHLRGMWAVAGTEAAVLAAVEAGHVTDDNGDTVYLRSRRVPCGYGTTVEGCAAEGWHEHTLTVDPYNAMNTRFGRIITAYIDDTRIDSAPVWSAALDRIDAAAAEVARRQAAEDRYLTGPDPH